MHLKLHFGLIKVQQKASLLRKQPNGVTAIPQVFDKTWNAFHEINWPYDSMKWMNKATWSQAPLFPRNTYNIDEANNIGIL